MIANQADICLVKETIQIGAKGFLTKHEDENIFAQAITYLHSGKVFITDDMEQECIRHFQGKH